MITIIIVDCWIKQVFQIQPNVLLIHEEIDEWLQQLVSIIVIIIIIITIYMC